jgi:hypothetical protein
MTTTKQIWAIGATVRVGFLTLSINGMHRDISNRRIWHLADDRGRSYEFDPYNGISRVK